MSNRIDPALTAVEWTKGAPGVYGFDDGSVFIAWRDAATSPVEVERPHAVIAALNASLSATDPRKITWTMVDALREWSEHARVIFDAAQGKPESVLVAVDAERAGRELGLIADVLAAYLPPRNPSA